MKATEAKLLEFLKQSPQFIIPIYQRTYSWTERECDQLWTDILRIGNNPDIAAHFVGSIVYIEKGFYQVSSQSPMLVIDGQQRLTTVMLILEALARHLPEGEPVDGFSARKIRSYYLLNPLEEGDRGFKLLLTQTDRDSLLALVQQKSLPEPVSIRIKDNFDFFIEKVSALGTHVKPLCEGLAKLAIVDIALNRDQDNPQLIFESMNSTGRELSQADLIRNFVLMGLNPDHQKKLYEDHWRPMELSFGQEAYGSHFDSFMRHYLTLKTGNIPNVRLVYEAFKTYAQEQQIDKHGFNGLVSDIHIYAQYYCAIALGKEPDKELHTVFQDLRDLKVDVAYPFFLAIYYDYEQKQLTKQDFIQAVRLVEAYVFRRAVCNIPPNSLNKTFATFSRCLHKDRYLESIQVHLLILPSYRRFPNDDEFRRALIVRDLYKFPRRSYLLRRLENHNRKERVHVEEYTIEHIMPQNKNLSKQWRDELGLDWKTIQETWLHTLGNLTLTGYNSEYSDHPFTEKRDMVGGFRHSPLQLNEGLGKLNVWNEDAIKQRAQRLADLASAVWARPNLTPKTLDKYRPKVDRSAGYSISDHHQIADGGPMRPLFDKFRESVLALDPCVTEEFLKLYVAYKAETNFVDVVPQSKRLRLSLNMPFHELYDPENKAKDITGVGRWGNGDVEIGLSKQADLPYVMGLVRQAFEKQMGDGDGTV